VATVIHPDGRRVDFAYTGIRSAHEQLGGYFDSIPGQQPAGYLVLVHDEGAVLSLPRNAHVEQLTGYPEVYGPAVIVSYEEADEDELVDQVHTAARAAFDQRLAAIAAPADA
jgi:hypothetical protein